MCATAATCSTCAMLLRQLPPRWRLRDARTRDLFVLPSATERQTAQQLVQEGAHVFMYELEKERDRETDAQERECGGVPALTGVHAWLSAKFSVCRSACLYARAHVRSVETVWAAACTISIVPSCTPSTPAACPTDCL
eukprot:6191038-Pleurochrysis_carterae.AAC.2